MSDIYDRSPIPASTGEQRCRAVRTVASEAVDAADCRVLLDVLGLRAEEGKQR